MAGVEQTNIIAKAGAAVFEQSRVGTGFRLPAGCGMALKQPLPDGSAGITSGSRSKTAMKKFLAIVFCSLPAFGQAANSGPGLYAGSAVYGASGSGGAPLTYSARTDNCVTGSESGCISGTTTGESGSALSFLLRTTDAAPFPDVSTGNANMNSTATDPDFGAYLVMATDGSTASANEGSASPWAASWDMGSAGEWDAFSLDSSMLMVGNNSGNWAVLYLNPTSIHNKTCATIPCVTNSGVGTNGTKAGDTYHLASNGSYSFSRVPGETNIIYEYYNPVATQVQVNKVAVCQNGTSSPNCAGWTGPGPLYRTTYKDFSYATGTQVLPANYYTAGATSTFTTANDGSVAIGIGGGVDWQASWVPAVSTILFPQAGNTNKGWQAIAVTGPTSSTEPTWSGCQTTIYVTTCSDGGVTWEYIGNVGSSQGSYFDIIGYHPGTGSYHLDTRTGIINRGTDSSAPAGAATTNDAIACTRYANGGTVTYPCPLPDVYTLHDFSQSMNGRYVIIAPDGAEGANASGNWDWGTLSGQTSNKVWEGAWSATQSYSKNQVVSNNGYFYSVTATTAPAGNAPPTPPTLSNSYWAQSEAWPAVYYWDVTGTLISPCTDYLNCNGHTAQGYIAQYWGGEVRQSAVWGRDRPAPRSGKQSRSTLSRHQTSGRHLARRPAWQLPECRNQRPAARIYRQHKRAGVVHELHRSLLHRTLRDLNRWAAHALSLRPQLQHRQCR